MKTKVVSIYLVVLLIFTFTFAGCQKSEKADDTMETESSEETKDESSEVETTLSDEADQPEEEPETDQVAEDLVYTIGNISFSYTDDLTIKDIEGLPYFYYNDSSFYYAESFGVDIGDLEDLDEELVTAYFDSATESFNQGSWQDGEMTGLPQVGEFNGLNVWVAEIAMQREGVPFISSTALVYHDGMLTNLTLVSDADSYQTNAPLFAETIASISPAN